MIDVSISINPFSVKNECGDFYLLTELEDYDLLAVGDIGGHGSSTVYQIATIIKEYILEHKQDNIKDILYKVHQHPSLKHTGMTIFLAQIYKTIPLLNYCAVGNTKGVIFRNNKLMNLHIQDGIIGYDIPAQIKVNMIKLIKNDLLLVATDGVSFHNTQTIVSKLKNTKDLDSITHFFTNDLKHEDDSLCIALKFNQLNANDFSIQYTNDTLTKSKPTKTLPLEKPLQKISTHHQNTFFSPYDQLFSFPKKVKLWKLEHKNLLIEDLEKEMIDLAIDKIKVHGSLKSIDVVKIKTFLNEVIHQSKIDLYLKDNLFQIVLTNLGTYTRSVEFIFEQYNILEDTSAIINIYLSKYVKLSNEEFKDLQKMIKLNLNDKDYIQYKEREQFLSDMAYKDNLTQIYNRNKFNELVLHELQRDNRYHRSFSVGIIDIDHFKSFNDTHGHLVGDEVLVLLAHCLKEHVRTTDTYARWGGEEFVLLFPETDINQACIAAENLRRNIENLQHPTAGSITASFGITQYKAQDTLESMFKRCDDALYDAKNSGRNRVCSR